MRKFLPLLVTLLALGAALALDVPKQLGAHPWWSQKNLLIGGGLGIATAFAAGFLPGPVSLRVIVFAVLSGFFFWAAQAGGIQFAASYAEDARAGQLWYLGWIATPAALSALLYTATIWLLSKR